MQLKKTARPYEKKCPVNTQLLGVFSKQKETKRKKLNEKRTKRQIVKKSKRLKEKNRKICYVLYFSFQSLNLWVKETLKLAKGPFCVGILENMSQNYVSRVKFSMMIAKIYGKFYELL